MYHHHARTVDETLISDTHGRQRRHERKVSKIDLKRARKYGMEEPARNGRLKYTYGGIVFIYDPRNNREVTTYKSRDFASTSSGTKVTEPCILRKTNDQAHHASLHTKFRTCPQKKWTSHSVLVVDMSGSVAQPQNMIPVMSVIHVMSVVHVTHVYKTISRNHTHVGQCGETMSTGHVADLTPCGLASRESTSKSSWRKSLLAQQTLFPLSS